MRLERRLSNHTHDRLGTFNCFAEEGTRTKVRRNCEIYLAGYRGNFGAKVAENFVLGAGVVAASMFSIAVDFMLFAPKKPKP